VQQKVQVAEETAAALSLWDALPLFCEELCAALSGLSPNYWNCTKKSESRERHCDCV